MKTWAEICKHCTVHQLTENTKTEIICKEEEMCNFVLNSDRAQGSLGRAQDSKGRAQHPHRYA